MPMVAAAFTHERAEVTMRLLRRWCHRHARRQIDWGLRYIRERYGDHG